MPSEYSGERRSSYSHYSMSQKNNEKPVISREEDQQTQTWHQPIRNNESQSSLASYHSRSSLLDDLDSRRILNRPPQFDLTEDWKSRSHSQSKTNLSHYGSQQSFKSPYYLGSQRQEQRPLCGLTEDWKRRSHSQSTTNLSHYGSQQSSKSPYYLGSQRQEQRPLCGLTEDWKRRSHSQSRTNLSDYSSQQSFKSPYYLGSQRQEQRPQSQYIPIARQNNSSSSFQQQQRKAKCSSYYDQRESSYSQATNDGNIGGNNSYFMRHIPVAQTSSHNLLKQHQYQSDIPYPIAQTSSHNVLKQHQYQSDIPYYPGFKFQMVPGTSPFDMSAYVTNPSGHVENCEIIDLDDCNYSIKFVPKQMAGGGAHKVRASGSGLVRGEVNTQSEFNIYTREAGAGSLAIAVEGPAKAEIDFFDRKDGSCGVSYVCPEPGEYQVSIKFNDEHIPDSPFTVNVSPPIGDAKKLTIHSLKTKGLEVNRPCTFTVNVNGARGRLDARVTAPSGAEDTCLVQEMGDEHYAIRFIPKENGVHWVHVRFNGRDIPDSPFRVVVGHANADPGRVFASGPGLYRGETGKPCEFLIDTMNAGAGALAVTVDGPSKVQLDCKEVSEGYRVTFTPTAPGDYLITIKFAGINIGGSPFKNTVTGIGMTSHTSGGLSTSSSYSQRQQNISNIIFETVERSLSSSHLSSMQRSMQSDAGKVRVKGQGLQRAFRNEKASFTVDTRDAGSAMLMVGVYGPKYPCEEVFIKHMGNNQYNVSYTVREKGEYMLIVKWGDQHIPGSPWHIEVV
ncbi:unnamed protein product [Didymodactylos carnosus]|uniref:Uncharacterized protein n=1 Tax=Didymodactylos carnosus TaxID=1234261 RepID=A0A8S2HG63_9BILA|nr:unnamed protein product [Didymodactylos carnosus]CAF3639457.1 unnamed protein product [Didymodactylos carnosus]